MTNMEPLDALFDDGPPAEAPIAPQPPDGALRERCGSAPPPGIFRDGAESSGVVEAA